MALDSHSQTLLLALGMGFGGPLRELRVGTGEDGTFVFTNVPVGRIWYLRPTMDSLAARQLAAAPLLCETQRDGDIVDVGDLHLRPAYSLRGKVVLIDGRSVAPNMHVTLGTDEGLDSQMTVLTPDGAFEFKGLATGVVELTPSVQGYELSGFTASLQILVDRDRNDVVIRMEPARR